MGKKKRSGRGKIVWAVAGVLIVALLFTVFVLRPRRSNDTKVQAKTGDITTYYTFSGTVAAKNSQVVYADRAMQINSVKVTQGQTVKQGDVLMTASTGESVTAPFDGVVSEIDAVEDAQQMPGAQLCKVVDYNKLELDIQVDEYDLAAISTGQTAAVTLNALNKDVAGTVTDVAREGVNQGGVTYFDAKVSLPAESDLRVGMTAQAKMLAARKKGVITLPLSAVQFDSENQPFVYEKEGRNTRRKVAVTVGINDGVNVEITKGLKAGDTVLVPDSTQSLNSFRLGRNGGSSQNSSSSFSSVSGASSRGGSGT